MQLLFSVILFAVTTTSFAKAVADTRSREFIDALNKVRSNPTSFLKAIDGYYNEWRSFVADKKGLQKAVAEIKQRLKKQKPLPPLAFDSALAHAAWDHASDCNNMNVVGHFGSDGSNPGTRVSKYSKIANIAECITYGQNTVQLMIAAMLVDEGTPNRGHRENMLSEKFSLIGVAIDAHPQYDNQCVVVLGAP